MRIKFIKFASSLSGAAFGLALAAPAFAGSQTDSATYSPNTGIPDFNLNGVSDTETFTSSIQSITGIQVSIDISGGYDGDFYAYLTHGSDFVVLLNRIGVNSGSQFGSYDSGMNVTFDDAAAGNVHDATVAGGVLTGAFQPDGRNVNPLTDPGTLESTPGTTSLSGFDTSDPNGAWTLFIADCSPVGIGTLDSWSLDITGTGTGVTVPDSGNTLALFGMSAGLLLALKRGKAAC